MSLPTAAVYSAKGRWPSFADILGVTGDLQSEAEKIHAEGERRSRWKKGMKTPALLRIRVFISVQLILVYSGLSTFGAVLKKHRDLAL